MSYLSTVPQKVLPKMCLTLQTMVSSEVKRLPVFCLLLFCSFQPSIFALNLPMWSSLPFSLPPSKLCSSIFKFFYLQKRMGTSGSVPSLVPVGMLGHPASSPGEQHRAWTLPLQEPPLASLSWFCFIWFSIPVCMSEIPWSKQRGGWETMTREGVTQPWSWSSLCFWNKNCILLSCLKSFHPGLQGKKGVGNSTDCLMFFSSQRVC